jgi:hypothetical protein
VSAPGPAEHGVRVDTSDEMVVVRATAEGVRAGTAPEDVVTGAALGRAGPQYAGQKPDTRCLQRSTRISSALDGATSYALLRGSHLGPIHHWGAPAGA